MKVILTDMNPRMISAWQEFFKGKEGVSIIEGDLTAMNCDAIVSPANSFGFMDGGVDYAISERLGWELEKRLQQQIRELPEGELLVGRAMVLETGDKLIPYLISAPTMRIPTNFNIDTSVNAYLAMKAALLAALQHPHISSVAITGFCTGVGRMQPIISARQMFIAWEEVCEGKKPSFNTFGEAQKHHVHINPQSMIWTH
ncbi:Appr-1-p processing protein [Pseudoflavitalea sp. G-6-1-2]|uniref:macro domain-containing protein n=1 Tax=Pseudoflavitalea sp. G-6-1-2 TaxID=2728841 RepID=UPI00146DD36C|nr:macro domain-containing protein [Pseudoflavitalea sp. G-6-1-2]NML20631.1 Appr-1-p processing protein [Pseudoflavitalea sp. G-6-1-2]